MSQIPEDLKYTKEHEWVRHQDDGTVLIGITDHAQTSLGDITFVELPETGESFARGDTFGVVESVKAASDLYMPLTGEIVEFNGELEDNPELVNNEPYDGAWMIRVKPAEPSEGDDLLNPADYAALL